MRKVLIIGAGEIGSRHLQGIAGVKENLSISVIDPSIDSLNLSKKRFFEVQKENNEHVISFSQNLSQMENLDLAIIATSSNVRKKVFLDLLEYGIPKYIIFEKFAFQKHNDFYEISRLLKKNKIRAWVNCPNRTFPSYKNIKKKLTNTKEIFMCVAGGNWGLASNSIHYLDLFSYLIDSSNIKIASSEIDKTLYKSKREGFYELGGEILFKSEFNSSLFLRDIKSSKRSVNITISTEEFNVNIDESSSSCTIQSANNLWKHEINGFSIPFQSTLTTELADHLLNTGKCELIDFNDSIDLHSILLKLFLDKFNKRLEEQIDYCPIT